MRHRGDDAAKLYAVASSRREPRSRPAYQALLEAITDGSVRTVLVWHTDRLHRQPTELETWIGAAERHGAVVQTVQAGNLDLATPSGRMVARMLGAAARYEVEHKIARQRAASEQAAAAGRRSGGEVSSKLPAVNSILVGHEMSQFFGVLI